MSPLPSSQLGTLRPDLNDALEEFDLTANRAGMIASLVAPPIDVDLQSDTFGKLKLSQLLRNPNVERASMANYSRDGFVFDTDTYTTKEYGLEQPVDARDAARFENYLDAEAVAGAIAQSEVLKAREIRTAQAVFDTSVWNTAALTTSVGVKWSTYATATPISDVEAARLKIRNGSGLLPNALIMDYAVFVHLRNCQQVIDRIAAAGAGDKVKANDISKSMLAQLFDVDYILVADAVKNTANETASAASIDGIWDDAYCMLAKVATTKNIKEPCIARTFHWTKDGSRIDCAMESYWEEQRRTTIIRARHDVHEKILLPQLGHLLSNIT